LAGADKAAARFEKGKQAYLKNDYKGAEKQFRAVLELVPDHVTTNMYLSHSLFYQRRYSEAALAYEKTAALAAVEKSLSSDEVRILTDNLGMAYGLSGQLDKAKALFVAAIEKDPDYPLYYYNLACTHSELGSLALALENLRLAFARRPNMIGGKPLPDPRIDNSFARYYADPQFQVVMKELYSEK
jgi:tetratricopeptide (TPR) repeat protein